MRRYVANLIIGKLNENSSGKPFLLRSSVLDKTSYATVSRFVNEALEFLFRPKPAEREKILLLVTDGAPYMIKAGDALKPFYPNMVHVTCLAHALNLIAEKVRFCYSLLNSLINNGKKIFLKAPLRVAAFKDLYPDTALPPEPVLTRWGTWLEAADYYATNYNNFKIIVNSFEPNSAAITECQRLLKLPELEEQIQFIKAHFVFLKNKITRLSLPILKKVITLLPKCLILIGKIH